MAWERLGLQLLGHQELCAHSPVQKWTPWPSSQHPSESCPLLSSCLVSPVPLSMPTPKLDYSLLQRVCAFLPLC